MLSYENHAELKKQEVSIESEATLDSNSEPFFPEGGLRAWLVVVGVWASSVAIALLRERLIFVHRFLTQFCSFG